MISLPLKRATVAGFHDSEMLDSAAERLTEFMAMHSFDVKWELTFELAICETKVHVNLVM